MGYADLGISNSQMVLQRVQGKYEKESQWKGTVVMYVLCVRGGEI